MKSLQKRYIYSSLLASLGFIILYLILDFNILLALGLTLVIYIAGIFIFKEKDVREYDPDDLNRYHFQTSKLMSYKDRIKNKEISKIIEKISNISVKTLSALTQKPKKVTQVYNFYDYYMGLLLKLVEKYQYLESKKELSEVEKKFLNDTENYLKNIEIQFQKQLDNMYKTESIDVQREIKLFENICHIEGLDKETKEGENND